MAFVTCFRTGEQVSEQMLQRLLGQTYSRLAATSGVGTGFAAGAVGIMNGPTGADPNHFAVLADGTDTVLTIRGGWCFVNKDAGTTSFDPLTFMVESSGPISYTVPANSSGTTRVDTICLRIDLSIPPDATGSNLPTIYNVQGGPSSALGNAPSDNALYFPLALVTIDNGETSLTTADVADLRHLKTDLTPLGVGPADLVGTLLPLGQSKLYVQFGSAVTTTGAGGEITVVFPVSFPNGVVTCMACPGDSAGGIGFIVLLTTSASVAGIAGKAYTTAGAVVNTLAIRYNFLAVGW